MADIRANFIAGRMNKSVDERLIPTGEYVDAQNVRLGSTETTEIGAVENSKGNTQLTFLAFEGNSLSPNAVCVGVYEDGMEETIYWFVHDPVNPGSPTGKVDLIVSFDTKTTAVTYHILSVFDGVAGSGKTTLNFNPTYLITGVSKIENQLYFTDDFNPPRYINVTRSYDDPAVGIDGIVEEDISVIVKPPGFEDENPAIPYIPLAVPKVTPTNFPGEENYMETRFICFAYRYRYQDGGYSATSLFSQPSFQPSSFRFDLDTFNNAGMKNRFNGALIEFSTGSKRVKEVDLLYKESGNNVIYVIERYNKQELGWLDEEQQSITFSNSKIYTTLGSDELLRQYDNVPRIAKAQTIQGNRLIYGNYIDGYNITNQNDQKIPIVYSTGHVVEEIGGVALDPPVASAGTAYDIGQDAAGGPASVSVDDCRITFDLSALELPIKTGLTLNFDISVLSAAPAQVTGGSNPIASGPDSDSTFQQTSPFSLTWSFTAPQDYATVNDMINSIDFQNPLGLNINGNYQQIKPINNSGSGGTLTDKFNQVISPPAGTAMEFINSAITDPTGTALTCGAPVATSTCLQQGFFFSVSGGSFTLQVPAVRFYSTTGPSEQFEFFSIEDFSSTVGYLLTSDTYSLHSNRDYETGIVYMDDYGRASTVLVSDQNTLYVPPINSRDKNTCKVTLYNIPPYWASKYKFVMKPSEGEYFTVFSTQYYSDELDPSVLWFKLEGDNTNIVTQGMNLVVKSDTNGPVNRNIVCKVLEIRAFSRNTLDFALPNLNPAGLYMCIKPGSFTTEFPDDATISYGNKTASTNATNCNLSNSYSLNLTNDVTGGGTPYDLPAGSSVRIRIDNWRGQKGNNCTRKRYFFDDTFTCSQDYPDFNKWWNGDSVNITNGSKIAMSAKQFPNSGNPFGTPDAKTASCFVSKFYCFTNGTDLNFRNRCGIKRCTSFWGDKRPGHVGTKIEVIRGGQLIIWETEPSEVDPNLFFDASQMLDIYVDPADNKRYHQSAGGATDVNQQAGIPLEVTLPFANCYTFGNGVESFRVTDSPGTKSFDMGQRVLAVSNQDFKEADRFAGLTYSGVYSGAANSNNLNEFNLGLVNYKDCEADFGPIQILHSRETDILCLQEDRISYVLAGKNVITDSTGGGAIASVPQVLGTQVARIEEYGISFNPESFATWGSDMFFTDAKRSSVINLRGTSRNTDQIQIISQAGMRSWFRDQFAEQLTTQKLGGYDPYMNEYVLSSNVKSLPAAAPGATPCGTTITQTEATNVLTYSVNVGDIIGPIDIDYTITGGGTMTVDATWDGTTSGTGPVSVTGTLTVQKTAATPNEVTVTITPDTSTAQGDVTYDITVNCPTQVQLTVVRVVLSSPSTSGQFIHFEYDWTDGNIISPSLNNLAALGTSTPTEYLSQTGIRSIGAFPYSGTGVFCNVTMKTLKQGFDDFVWNTSQNSMYVYPASILYPNTTVGVTNLMTAITGGGAAPLAITGLPGQEQGTKLLTPPNFPTTQNYLYLVWDLRQITSSDLCYSTTTALDACCGCSPLCTSTTWFGPQRPNIADVCNTNTNSPGAQQYSFEGSGAIPQIGEVCYADTTCNPSALLPTGYYIVDPNQPAAVKNWIEVGNNGEVIASGTC